MLISAICQKVRPPITSPRVSCPHCDQTFSKKSNLNAHLKRKHLETIQRNIKLYQCDKCPKQFTRLVQSYWTTPTFYSGLGKNPGPGRDPDSGLGRDSGLHLPRSGSKGIKLFQLGSFRSHSIIWYIVSDKLLYSHHRLWCIAYNL